MGVMMVYKPTYTCGGPILYQKWIWRTPFFNIGNDSCLDSSLGFLNVRPQYKLAYNLQTPSMAIVYNVSIMKHTYWSYFHQLSYRLGAHFVDCFVG
jgi:hypothetical protein